jgi:two-component system phosphate regulon sensor histidine kinase PhoR
MIMAQQAARMKRLIDDLLSLSRIEMKAHMRPDAIVDLSEILQHVLFALEPLARDNHVDLNIRVMPPRMPLRGDRDELVQVFSNLIENAIKYGASGGRVDIVAGDEPQSPGIWLVTIRDYGPGIGEEHLPRLTERFYRADVVSSREKQGTGLGLAIVKHILTRHHARLQIESVLGDGAMFAVRLEAEADASVEAEPPAMSALAESATVPRLTRRTGPRSGRAR